MSDEPERGERRSAPRMQMAAPVECAFKVQSRVSILDVSRTGMLLHSDVVLPPGTRVHVRTFLDGSGFDADVQVKRAAARQRGVAESGVMFVRMDEASQRSLEQFLRKAKD